MKSYWKIIALIVVVFAVSCKTKKSVIQQHETISAPVAELVSKVTTQEPKFSNANVSKMTLWIKLNSRSAKVSASCKLLPDSAIHISVMPALGIEMFKMEIDHSTITIFDKMNKRYFEVDYDYIERILGVKINFANLQAMISNKLFFAGFENIPQSKLKIERADGKQILKYDGNQWNQTVTLNQIHRIEQMEINTVNTNYHFVGQYADFAETDSISFPRKIIISVNNARNNLDCEFNINKAEFNTEINLQMLDRSRFTKAEIEKLLKK